MYNSFVWFIIQGIVIDSVLDGRLFHFSRPWSHVCDVDEDSFLLNKIQAINNLNDIYFLYYKIIPLRRYNYPWWHYFVERMCIGELNKYKGLNTQKKSIIEPNRRIYTDIDSSIRPSPFWSGQERERVFLAHLLQLVIDSSN